jgi:hypothetical protein
MGNLLFELAFIRAIAIAGLKRHRRGPSYRLLIFLKILSSNFIQKINHEARNRNSIEDLEEPDTLTLAILFKKSFN